MFTSNDGPTGAPKSPNQKKPTNNTVTSNPFYQRLHQISRVYHPQVFTSFHNGALNNIHNDSVNEMPKRNITETANKSSNKTQHKSQEPPEDALALLSFSKTVALGMNGDKTRMNSKQTMTSSAAFHTPLGMDPDRESASSKIKKHQDPDFQYPIDFAAGLILRQKLILPILKSSTMSSEKDFKALNIKLMSTFSQFMRGEQIYVVLPNHDVNCDMKKKSKRKNAHFLLHEHNLGDPEKTDNPKKRHHSDLNECIDSNMQKSGIEKKQKTKSEALLTSLGSENQSVNNKKIEKILNFARIQRCEGKDAKTLSLWYHQLGDKYLVETCPSWSKWWENKCRIPEPSCEMIKLVLTSSSSSDSDHDQHEDETDTIAGVIYYERNVPDKMRNGDRSTIIRGIRLNPQFNPEVINRSQLIPSKVVTDTSAVNEIVTSLCTNVIFNSLLCGTSSVGVSSHKNEMEEKYYKEVMGDAISFREEDGRKYFMMKGDARFEFLRSQFEKQIDLHAEVNGRHHQHGKKRNECKPDYSTTTDRDTNKDIDDTIPRGIRVEAENRNISDESTFEKIKAGKNGASKSDEYNRERGIQQIQ